VVVKREILELLESMVHQVERVVQILEAAVVVVLRKLDHLLVEQVDLELLF
jgi:hypothetical protein